MGVAERDASRDQRLGAALAHGGEALMRVLGITPAVRGMMREKALAEAQQGVKALSQKVENVAETLSLSETFERRGNRRLET